MIVTLDFICLRLNMTDKRLDVLLHERSQGPETGSMALPGGWVWEQSEDHGDYYDDDLSDSVSRILRIKVGVVPSYMEQIPVQGGLKRDPSLGWSVTIPHFCILNEDDEAKVLEDGQSEWISVEEVCSREYVLPFDHNQLVSSAYDVFLNKITYSSLLLNLMPKEFIIADVVNAFTIFGLSVSKQTVINRMVKTGIIVDTGKIAAPTGPGKPASLYRVANPNVIYFDAAVGKK